MIKNRALKKFVAVFALTCSFVVAEAQTKSTNPGKVMGDTVPVSKEMEAVIITGKRPLVIMKGDTAEFKASAYKTPPNSKAADLLKRLPGLMIDSDGKLSYNGRPITKLLVNGKIFFNENGQVALNNIPTDLIDKIQITDFLSEEDKMMRRKNRTGGQLLNIKLKSDRFATGNAWAIDGTDKRYDLGGFVSSTRKAESISFSGGLNNVNRLGSSINDPVILGLTDGGGIIKTFSGGVNYSNTFNKHTDVQGSYIYSNPVTTKESVLERRQFILQDSSLFTTSKADMNNRGHNHELNAILRNQSKWIVVPKLVYGTADNMSTSDYSTFAGSEKLNDQKSVNVSQGKDLMARANLTIPFLKTRKDALMINSSFMHENRNLKNHNISQINFYKNNVVDSMLLVNQLVEEVQRNTDVGIGLAYNHLVDTGFYIYAESDFLIQNGSSNRNTFNVNENNTYKIQDSLLSNRFNTRTFNHSLNSALNWTGKHIEVNGGVRLFQNYLQRDDMTRGIIGRQQLVKLLPFVNLSSAGFKNHLVAVRYSQMYENPTLDQLQPVPDNTNPLFQILGNSNLKPQGTHNVGISYRQLEPSKNMGATVADIGFTPYKDRIVSSLFNDSLGRQYIQYQNVSGVYSAHANFYTTLNYTIGKNRIIINPVVDIIYTKDKNFINNQVAVSRDLTIRPSLALSYFRSDKVEAVIRYVPSFNSVKNGQNKAQNQDYVIQQLHGNLSLYILKRIKWNSAVNYVYNTRFSEGFNKSSLLWTMNVSYLCLKDKKSEIRASAFDILKQNRNILRTVGNNFIEESQANNLQQYFTLGFVFNFSRTK